MLQGPQNPGKGGTDRALPPPQPALLKPSPSLLDTPIPEPAGVPGQVGDVEGLRLTLVKGRRQRQVWNTLVKAEHPCGVRKFIGCQVKYLVESDHGLLGAASFTSATYHLKVRDRWMTWSDGQREANQHRAVYLSRFLIRLSVECGYRPWLAETYVDAEHDGACFRAAKFTRLGETSGRGPSPASTAASRRCTLPSGNGRWRERLGVARVELFPALEPDEGLGGGEWAQNKFEGAKLADRRHTAQAVKGSALLGGIPARGLRPPAATRPSSRGFTV